MIYISFQLPKKSHIITLWAVYTKLCRHLPVIYHKNGRHHSLIPAKDLSDLSKIYPLRTTETMKEVYETAQKAGTMAEKEVILKEYGLHNVEVG